MAIFEQTPGLLEALSGEMTPKFLATRSADGIPNVVPCISIQPTNDQPDTLFFGNFLLRKSIKNLQSDSRLGVLVITPELKGWILKGDFIEFQRTGPYVDRQMSSNLLRYNAYTGIRNAGVFRVTALECSFSISKLKVALDFLLARFQSLRVSKNHEGIQVTSVPLPVQHEFGKMAAVKVLAWIGQDGYPYMAPALSLQPAGDHALVAWMGGRGLPKPQPGVQVATNILTFEAISYQAKGQWQSLGQAGAMQVQEVYAGGPPSPGGRVS